MIDITLIGTGALQPLPERALASAAITCQGRVLLIDCGEGTQSAARRAGVSLMKIDAIALTHYHGDHTYGLPGLLQSMAMAGREEAVIILGPKGLDAAMEPFLMLCRGLPFELQFCELAPQGISLGERLPGWPKEAYLTPFLTSHRVSSQGYRFELRRPGRFLPEAAKALHIPVTLWSALQRGQSVCAGVETIHPSQVMTPPRKGICVVYTGDTSLCAGMAEAAKDCDLLICEATYAGEEHAELAHEHGHMTFYQAAQLAKDAGAGALWLTHYSPRIEDPQAELDIAGAIFPQTECGMDGMRATLRFAN